MCAPRPEGTAAAPGGGEISGEGAGCSHGRGGGARGESCPGGVPEGVVMGACGAERPRPSLSGLS